MGKCILKIIICFYTTICYAESSIETYFTQNIDTIQNIFDIQNSDGLIVVESVNLTDEMSEFCRVVDLLSEKFVFDIHNPYKLKRKDFNLIKDWYFINKDKLTWDLIKDAINLNRFQKIIFFIPNTNSKDDVFSTPSVLESCLRDRLKMRGIK